MSRKVTKEKKADDKVRKFSDSVYRPGEFIFCFVLLYLITAGFEFLLIFYADISDPNARALLAFSALGYALPIISIISAKRSHSSKFWRSVARVCYKDGYLKVDDTHPRDRDE